MKDAILPLSTKKKEIIQHRYFERKSWKEVGALLYMESRCLETQDQEILKKIKENLLESSIH